MVVELLDIGIQFIFHYNSLPLLPSVRLLPPVSSAGVRPHLVHTVFLFFALFSVPYIPLRYADALHAGFRQTHRSVLTGVKVFKLTIYCR